MYARGATPESPVVRGWSAPAGAVVPALPAAIPATCVPWNDACGSTASLRAVVRARADERAGDDHLRRRPLRAALREAGGVAVALRVEERVRLVDAVVDDGDLHPLAAAAAGGCERARADQARAAVERERVAVARVELAREGELRRLRQLGGGQLDGHPVQEQACSCARRWRSGSPASASRPRRAAPAGAWPRRPWRRGSARSACAWRCCRRACGSRRRGAGRTASG